MIPMVHDPLAHVFGQMQGQRPVGAEQAITQDGDNGRAVLSAVHIANRRWRKRHGGFLAQSHRFARRQRITPERLACAAACVQPAQHMIQTETIGVRFKLLPEVWRQRIGRGHRIRRCIHAVVVAVKRCLRYRAGMTWRLRSVYPKASLLCKAAAPMISDTKNRTRSAASADVYYRAGGGVCTPHDWPCLLPRVVVLL